MFSGGDKAGTVDDYTAYEYSAAPYAVDYEDTLYLYGTGADGKGSYTTFDGSSWSEYSGWESQPADFQWQPTSVSYNGSQYVYYTGKDNKLYQNVYDGQSWSDWADLDENYAYEPILYAYGDEYYLTYTGADGSLYYKTYDAAAKDEPEDDGY